MSLAARFEPLNHVEVTRADSPHNSGRLPGGSPLDLSAQLTTALADRYELEREIGAGGMAIVYLARDLKHNRRVALKVLRPELGAVLGVERFLSEIQVTANLQHPNLLPLFDSGEVDGQLFYVMPYVEGESLRARLEREKQLPLADALHIAVSVASALDYAHRHGVIHRDLKPENILLHDGEPLVADFGIALAVSNAGGSRVTQTGLSLGTPQYMSPEQATGDRSVDRRSDIYSLAAVTYEMLVGEPPHIGNTSQAVIARVLTERPRSVRVTRPNVPEHVERAVAQGLEKLPADRFASAREFADALAGKVAVAGRTAADASAAASPSPASSGRRDRALRIGLAASAAIWVATIAAAAMLFSRAPEEIAVRFQVPTPPAGTGPLRIAVSPDGRLLTFAAETTPGGPLVLWVRALDENVARPLPGTEGAVAPFWSPDSRFIGYGDGTSLRTIDVTGGAPQTVAAASGNFWGGAWNEEGTIVFAVNRTVDRVAATGGTAVEIMTATSPHTFYRFPAFLPDGRHFLFLAWSPTPGERGIYVSSLEGGVPALVVRAESKPAYTRAGFLMYLRQGTLVAQRFDPRRLEVVGEPIQVADGIRYNVANGMSGYSVSETGVLVFRTGYTPNKGLEWYRRNGEPLPTLSGESGPYTQITLSPDERQVALQRVDPVSGASNIWTLDLATDIPTRVTFDNSVDPIWFPDSRALAFVSLVSDVGNFHKKVLGSSGDTVLFESAERKFVSDISADGRFLLYLGGLPSLGLLALPLDGGAPIPLSDNQFGKDGGRFAPDGRSVSYGSNETGVWEVHVASFPAFDQRRQLSRGGGVQGRWRADGRELFYLSPDGGVMAVAVRPGPVAEFSAPALLFRSPLVGASPNRDEFGVSADGQRFLFLTTPEQESTLDPITVWVNWQRGLEP